MAPMLPATSKATVRFRRAPCVSVYIRTSHFEHVWPGAPQVAFRPADRFVSHSMATHQQAPHSGQQFQQTPHAASNRVPSTGQMQHHTGPPPSANFSEQHHAVPPMQHHQHGRNGGAHFQRSFIRDSLPLRIAVNSKYVGAIIGQGGATISDISKESSARCVIDHSRNRALPVSDPALMEKIISIHGSLDACSKACIKILEVVRREMEKDHTVTDEYELKIRVFNELVGRLIGKSGKTIKSIKSETGAYVSVSNDPGNIYDLSSPQPYSGYVFERSITVRARDLEAVSRAERMISSNLRKSYDTDGQKMYNAGAFGGLPIAPYVGGAGQPGVAHPAILGTYPLTGQSRSVKLFVPNAVIGALIGSKGAYIKKMIQNTGAQIRIDNSDYHREKRNTVSSSGGEQRHESPEHSSGEELKVPSPIKEGVEKSPCDASDGQETKRDLEVPEKGAQAATAPSKGQNDVNGGSEKEKEQNKSSDGDRLVTITGIDGQVSNALYYIFDKVAEQIFCPLDELRLHSEITVPSSLVGRIIGKSGQNVRELQRITQAVVKIPEDSHRNEPQVMSFDEEPLSTVRIYGCYFATQAVEIRINQLVFEHRQRLVTLQRQPNCDTWQQSHPAASPSGGQQS
ncbi:hypothetical protein QR680_013139 [Steinernema hermaphroditum]|uniref:K Homology domain-containing protein n=1 Tax=Steinernema hermaphroditum TaxID=289476 RepID=A0AA39I4H4_9BILA|nr:hypothetical protein QR680_013139 [Steinernema hermaphroditum]